MAHSNQTYVVCTSVLKGYHVYRHRMTNSKTYMCEAEADNCIDKNAVLVKCTENNEIIGHVPALPIPLNKAFRQIMNLDSSISIEW